MGTAAGIVLDEKQTELVAACASHFPVPIDLHCNYVVLALLEFYIYSMLCNVTLRSREVKIKI
jgi:hypothetical protein